MKKNKNKSKSSDQDINLELENNNDLDVEYESHDDDLDYYNNDEDYEDDLMVPEKSSHTRSIRQVLQVAGGLSFVGISTLLVATSVAISTQSVNPLGTNPKLFFDNKTFDSKEELMEYAQANYFQSSQSVENRVNWSIDEKGQKLYFNDPKLLREHLMKGITQTSALSSRNFNLSQGGLGEVSASDFSNLYFNKTEDELKTNIYRGKNNSIHTSVEEAKNSYLSIHDAFYFNNIYFRNIEELKVYLQTVYYVQDGEGYDSKKINKNIGIVGPDGIVSSGINSYDLYNQMANDDKTDQAKNDFLNNISNQAKKYIEFTDKDGRFFYADEKKLEESNPAILNAFNNIEYTRRYTNDGKGTYIVDLDKDDSKTLFGPYYLRTSGDIASIKDTKQWKQIEKNDPLITKEQNSNLLASLLNIILFEDTDKDPKNSWPINIDALNAEVLIPFYNMLQKQHPKIYNGWQELSQKIRSGKRNNTFFNIPIFYIYLIENLMEAGASQHAISQTKQTFNSIAKYLDNVIRMIFPQSLLKIKAPSLKYGDYLSFEEIFDFNNNDFNLNVDIAYFSNEIANNFSQFLVAINIVTQANLNAMYNGGTLPFRTDFIKAVMGINSVLVQETEEARKSYEVVWNLFSSTEINDVITGIQNLPQNKTKIINFEFLKKFSFSFSITGNIFSSANLFTFKENFSKIELSSDLQTIVKDKYGLLKDFTSRGGKLSFVVPRLVAAKDVLSWKNFMLIKFIHKYDKNKLVAVSDFGINQNELQKLLLDMVNKANLNIYIANFIIDPTITQSLVTLISGGSVIQGKFLEFLTRPGTANLVGLVDKIKSVGEDMIKAAKNAGLTSTLDSLSSLKWVKAISGSKILKSISIGLPYLQAGLIALDIIGGIVTPVTKYHSYVFELEEGQKFIWNGGHTTTMVFGLVETSSTGIKDMKMLDPKEIVKPKSVSDLYFNGKTYSDVSEINELKKDQLRAVLNGEFQSKNIKVVYSFDNIATIDEQGPSTQRSDKAFYHFGEINDLNLGPVIDNYENRKLVQYVYKTINEALNSTDPNHYGKRYYQDKFIFANGVVATNPNDAQEILIKNVIENISPVKIALLPKLDTEANTNKPLVNNDGNTEDGSLAEYTLPSRSWAGGLFSINKSKNKYVIFDPNQEKESKPKMTDADVVRNVKTLFYDYFDVDSKTVIKDEIATNNVFSTLAPSIITNVIFQVKLENNMTKYFFDQASAFNWLLSQKNFTLYSYTTQEETFQYKGQIFTSREEFIKFILDEATVEVN